MNSSKVYTYPDQMGDIVGQIKYLLLRNGTTLNSPPGIAVDGKSGSGKSTISKAIGNELGALVIEGDDFFTGGTAIRDDPLEVLAEECVDWRSQHRVIGDLKVSGTSSHFRFCWSKFDGSRILQCYSLQDKKVIILEGVYSARREIEDLVDISILVMLDGEERERRLHLREGSLGAWEQQWISAEDWYFSNRVGTEKFDLIINN